ncbi:MAG: hypothetical protein ACTHJQ_02160 [Rhizobiaceae bacterium]
MRLPGQAIFKKMTIFSCKAGLERLRELLPLHIDEYGDLDIEALSKADGYHTETEIDDLVTAGLLNWPEPRPIDIRPTASCRTAEPENVPVGWAISRDVTVRYSQTDLERAREIAYRFFDEFSDRDLTEADIYGLLGAGLLDEWLEPLGQ